MQRTFQVEQMTNPSFEPNGYCLYYWPSVPGRGEFPRLILEAAQVPYVDVGRLPEAEGGGIAGIRRFWESQARSACPVFAPPFLGHQGVVIGQTANVCLYLGQQLGLVPADPAGIYHANQLQLTILDVTDEIHNVHHPLGVSLYYHEQQAEAQRAAATFLKYRLGRFLNYFEGILEGNASGWLLGDSLSYVDLSLFFLWRGLDYAFPRNLDRLKATLPHLQRHFQRVSERPAIAAYLQSDRCLPFNDHGVFRHYPELDQWEEPGALI